MTPVAEAELAEVRVKLMREGYRAVRKVDLSPFLDQEGAEVTVYRHDDRGRIVFVVLLDGGFAVVG